jgi:asparagine synthase (glutamine-hydrolysing)
MCGIAGVAAAAPVPQSYPLDAMRDVLRPRGPDDGGSWWSTDRRVGLANRRLAIVDLSPAGHQPMSDVSGQCEIAFNGEIYNHADLRTELQQLGFDFRSKTDTEVILQAYRAWGDACLNRLNGMFAFALYDSAARRLLLARDRAGEKPLFYWHTAGRLVFGSELKALMADPAMPRVLDPEALEFFLAYGYVPDGMCLLGGVRKLPAAHAASYSIDSGSWRVFEYWRLPAPPAAGDDLSPELATSTLDSLLEDAVRRQLVADVPVGVLLSGGLDSSLVTAMAARVSPRRIKTFTVGFPGHARHDEREHARIVATHFGTEHIELAAEAATVELLPALARQYDEPIADSSMVPTFLVSQLVRRHATVALGGDGADELFGGYQHYSWLQRQERIRHWIPRPVRVAGGAAVERLVPVGVKGRNYAVGFTRDLPHSIAHVNLYFDGRTRDRLLRPLGDRRRDYRRAPEDFRANLVPASYSALRQATEADFRTTMCDAFLVKVDRASMLNSLEVRAPWLDYRIVEFAFGRVPDDLRATTDERKILPRLLAKKLLPPQLDVRRKQGFSIPLHEWFKGEWGAFIESVLRASDFALFDRRSIHSLLDNQRRGYLNSARLFALTMFELWRREYRIAS